VTGDLEFFVELANLLKHTPPKAQDAVVAESLSQIGFKDHNTFFDIAISGELLVTCGLTAGNIVFDIEKTCHEVGIKNGTNRYLDWYRKITERDKDIPILSGVTSWFRAPNRR